MIDDPAFGFAGADQNAQTRAFGRRHVALYVSDRPLPVDQRDHAEFLEHGMRARKIARLYIQRGFKRALRDDRRFLLAEFPPFYRDRIISGNDRFEDHADDRISEQPHERVT